MEFLQTIKNLLRTAYHYIPPEIRLGRVYREQLRFIHNSTQWSPEKMAAWQIEELRKTLSRSFKETAFYRSLMDDVGLIPEDIHTLEDFQKIPTLDKDQIRAHKGEMISRRYSRGELRPVATSGTSGVPLGLFYLKGLTDQVEKAFIHHGWSRFGLRSNCWNIFLRGQVIRKGVVEKRGLNLYLSSFHLTERHMEEYDRAIRSFRPAIFQAYPSSLIELCKFMRRHYLSPYESLGLIVCSSENISTEERSFIEGTLHVPICNLYGNAERTVFACSCPHSNHLHFYPQYGLVELLNDRNENCCVEGELGELVTTAFTSPAFPLIRYRTGDLATFTGQTCECGWNYRICEGIQGRNQEYLVTKDGRKIGIVAVSGRTKVFFRLKRFQFIQRIPGEVTFKYVTDGEKLTEKELTEMLVELSMKMGNDITFKVEEVTDIPRGSRGKQNMLIQEIRSHK